MTPALTISADKSTLAVEAGRFLVATLVKTIAELGKASIVLAGGKTPRAVYEILPSIAREARLDWQNVHLFWGDERCVPPDHPESNFRMVNESLLRHIDIPPENIHRIMAEHTPEKAAAHYCEEIRRFFQLKESDVPVFDLLLLGLGPDGHIASIFPGSSAEIERDRLVTAVHVEKLQTDRITLTLPVLSNASAICILVSGGEKSEIVKTAIEGGGGVLPVHRLHPVHGELRWFADREAAGLLKERNI
jgi:6-phosphogluconolactonase